MLDFEDLMDEAQAEIREHSLQFKAKGGTMVTLRPVTHLEKAELKAVRGFLSGLQNEDLDIDLKLDAMDAVLVAVSDRKEAMRKSLAALPISMRTRLFEAWHAAVQLPEA